MALADTFPALVEEAARLLNSSLAGVDPLAGGHTGDRVVRLHLEDGRTAVLKAAPCWKGEGVMLEGALLQERTIYREVPELAPWRPNLLGMPETDAWIGLLIDDLGAGGPLSLPWSPTAVEQTATGLAALHAATLDGPRPASVLAPSETDYWPGIDAESLPEPWCSEDGLRWLAEAEAAATPAIAALAGTYSPRCVTHGDVIDGNVFLVAGDLVLIDWAKAAWTSPARDAVRWAVAVEAYGGGAAAAALAAYSRHASRPSDVALRATLASHTGYLLHRLGEAGRDNPARPHLETRLLPPALWFASEFGLPPPPLPS